MLHRIRTDAGSARAVISANRRRDQPIIDQLSKNAVKRLFRDLQDVQQTRNRYARPSLDEVDGPVVGPAKTAGCQNCIWI